ncbi:hypothetical protein C7271_02285 [filamentous cyanobacterium CCP5]|nr:hypothetical protein C7271_02285 [filamentous cyanobacterium CCP5]
MTNSVPEAYQGQRTLAAIVLTDAVGFSARMSIEEELTLKVIRRDQKLMETLCQQYEGRVIKSTGDGLLMFFSSAVQAVSCALAIQQQLSQSGQNLAPDKVLQHRIGVHLGDVFCSQTDVMGNGVNIAARLQTEARAGGICISQVVYDVVKSRLALNATFAGPLHLKNIQEPLPAYHLELKSGASTAEEAPLEVAASSQTEPAAAAPPPSRERLDPESKVGGRYTIQRVLGQGGFGRSYLVKDTQRFGEFCVLKEFFPANKSGRSLQKALDLFKREAKTLYQINHPQVPTFLACFTQGQRLFIVQEFIDGVTYSQLLRQRKREGRFFSEEEVTRWLMHMLQVLDHLHGLGIVHRDISPDNVIYSPERDLPVLIDFGLVNDAVSDLLASTADISVTRLEPKAATMVGKFGYSPPEQMNLGQCYPCSDLYALGVTAIVMLTGRYPRELIDRDTLEWQWQHHVSLSPDLILILDKLVRQKPRDRFQTARQVLDRVAMLVPNPTSPLPVPRTTPIDLSSTENAAPVFDAPLQVGQPVSRDATFIEHCRQELTRFVGPIASILIEEALDQYPQANPRELVEILASQLSDGNQATDFVSRLQWPDEQPGEPGSHGSDGFSGGSTGGDLQSASQAGASGAQKVQEALDPLWMNRCRQALTKCVGPMADFLLEEILSDYPHLGAQELIQRLSAEIPDSRKAQEFLRQLQ